MAAQLVKSLLAVRETQVQSLGCEDPMEKEKDTPLQYSCLGNPMDRGDWWATVHGVTESDTTQVTNTYFYLAPFQKRIGNSLHASVLNNPKHPKVKDI